MGREGQQRTRRWISAVVAQSAVFAALLWGLLTTQAKAGEGSAGQLTLEAIENCMARAPAPWPEAWKQEYVATIRQAIAPNADGPDYDARLDILRRGFPAYWEGLTKTKERSLFEGVHDRSCRGDLADRGRRGLPTRRGRVWVSRNHLVQEDWP